MTTSRWWIAVAVTLLCSVPVIAQKAPQKLTPGDYVTEGGWGNLTLKRDKSGTLHFSIETVGANGHSCSLDGALHDGRATLNALDEPCVITMEATAEGVDVKADREACRSYCGARAGFESFYFRPAPACAARTMAGTRKTFQQLYDARKFAEARSKLEPLLKDCERWLDPLTKGRIRNDLAVTLHKLGDLTACRALLEPLADDAALSEEELLENYPPFDAESLMPILRTTRTNLALCREK